MVRPNIDFSQLRAFLFCRQVVRGDSGITLVDVHDTRFSKTFPVQFDDLFLYASFEALREEAVLLEVQMRLPSGEVRTAARNGSSIDESLLVTSEIPFGDLSFDAPGQYSFALYANGRLIGVTPLHIALPHTSSPQEPKRN